MKLHCHVGGNVKAAPDGFDTRLCQRVAKTLGADLVHEDDFSQALKADEKIVLARIKILIRNKSRLEYNYAQGSALEWANGTVLQGDMTSIDLLDGPPLDAAIDQLINDLERRH